MLMMRVTRVLPVAFLALRHIGVATHNVGRPGRITYSRLGEAVLALVVETLLPIPPRAVASQYPLDVFSLVAPNVIHATKTIPFGVGASALPIFPEAHHMSLIVSPMLPPIDNLILEDCDQVDDSPSWLPVPVLGNDLLLPPPIFGSVSGATHASLWPIHYLARPQCLTRFEPLPVGRDISPTYHR